jgi:hypothetical protein
VISYNGRNFTIYLCGHPFGKKKKVVTFQEIFTLMHDCDIVTVLDSDKCINGFIYPTKKNEI